MNALASMICRSVATLDAETALETSRLETARQSVVRDGVRQTCLLNLRKTLLRRCASLSQIAAKVSFFHFLKMKAHEETSAFFSISHAEMSGFCRFSQVNKSAQPLK